MGRTIDEEKFRILFRLRFDACRPDGERDADAAGRLDCIPEVVLVVGAANPALEDLKRHAARLPVPAVIRHDVRHMAALLAGAALGVSAAGPTGWLARTSEAT